MMQRLSDRWAVLLLLCAAGGAAACQSVADSPPEPAPPQPAQVDPQPQPAADANKSPAQSEADAQFQELLAGMGVRYFAAEHKLEVSGWVNMQSGLVEVFACAPQGKTHEAVIVLDCVPRGLHAGLLALDLNPGTPVEFGTGDAYKPPTGDAVEIDVRWLDADGVEHTARAEDWVWDEKTQQPMPHSPWLFAGSFLQQGPDNNEAPTYAADYVKSLATTYHDASSILETSELDGIDDTVYYSNEKAVPPVGTPLTAIFRRAR